MCAVKSTAYSVHQGYNSPPSKRKKHRHPTQIHRMTVRMSVTSVNSAGRQAANRQLLNRQLGQSLCSFFPRPGFSWSTIYFQRKILPTELAFVSYHPVARHFSLFLKWRNNFYPLSVDNQCSLITAASLWLTMSLIMRSAPKHEQTVQQSTKS